MFIAIKLDETSIDYNLSENRTILHLSGVSGRRKKERESKMMMMMREIDMHTNWRCH